MVQKLLWGFVLSATGQDCRQMCAKLTRPSHPSHSQPFEKQLYYYLAVMLCKEKHVSKFGHAEKSRAKLSDARKCHYFSPPACFPVSRVVCKVQMRFNLLLKTSSYAELRFIRIIYYTKLYLFHLEETSYLLIDITYMHTAKRVRTI